MDIKVTFPQSGEIHVDGPLFADGDGEHCRRFLACVFAVPEVERVTVADGRAARAVLHYSPERVSPRDVLARVSRLLARKTARVGGDEPGRSSDSLEIELPRTALARDRRGVIRFQRHDDHVSGWCVVREKLGHVKLRHPALHRRREVADALERELMAVLGVDKYSTNTLLSTVSVDYDPRQLSRRQVVEILDGVLAGTTIPTKLDKLDLTMPLVTASLPLAAAAQFAFPPLMPAAALLFAYTSIPTFLSARDLLFKERRIGCDVLDAIVVIGCLSTLQILPGAVLIWCLALGRTLVKRTEDRSKRMLLNVFGKQPRFVWVVHGGVEVRIPMHELKQGDVIVVNTGDVMPVDGVIAEGFAMIDQHALTGESTPAEKGPGDRVFASTVLVAGKVFVAVEHSGTETASAKIGKILADTAGYKLARQHAGERLADTAALPMIGLGALGFATLGPAGAVAIVNCDLGTGIRMAAPLAMLSSLALCASKGILIKDGRALDLMSEIDTVLFDKTGTLTRERPEVGTIHACAPWSADEILRFAAAAEQKFHHPIALAILHAAADRGLELAPVEESEFKVGFGITVKVDGRVIRVGSRRFIEMEGIAIDDGVAAALDRAHALANTMVLVAVDDALGGAIELQAAIRPEVAEIVKGLRDRGIKHLAIISGDHEAPTRRLAEQLGMDRYFAQVLPADKADYVAKLQAEGRKVCFVGDGINDSIALKKANVSISLRGASTIATDTAHIVFLDEGLAHLCDLRDISQNLHRNVRRSWHMIVAPNAVCVAGVFTMGFGIFASVFFNNVTALAAAANGLWPMRKVAENEARRKALLAAAVADDRPAGPAADRPAGTPRATAAV
ncbi:MAG: heavy metal translocating P-type ATPase [Planctomycetia bacterium]|nr:heavy metal translocating P-type ATPase [Planctomycetia bacterium]